MRGGNEFKRKKIVVENLEHNFKETGQNTEKRPKYHTKVPNTRNIKTTTFTIKVLTNSFKYLNYVLSHTMEEKSVFVEYF